MNFEGNREVIGEELNGCFYSLGWHVCSNKSYTKPHKKLYFFMQLGINRENLTTSNYVDVQLQLSQTFH